MNNKYSMNNQGYSLIELIIVLAIIAILTVFSFNSVTYMSYANSKKTVSEIDNYLSKVRLESMSKINKSYAVVLSKETDGYYIYCLSNTSGVEIDEISKGTLVGNKKKIANKEVVVTYKFINGVEEFTLDSSNSLIIRYRGDSGAFASEYSSITIKSGARVSILKLVKKTGKHYIAS